MSTMSIGDLIDIATTNIVIDKETRRNAVLTIIAITKIMAEQDMIETMCGGKN